MTSGLVAVILGSLVRPMVPVLGAVAIVSFFFATVVGHELGLYRLPLPQNARQVPQSIVDEGGPVGGLQFGFEMGTGVRTFMTSGLPHVLFVMVFLLAPWPDALLAGASFGAGRAWMALSRLWHGDVHRWDEELLKRERQIRIAMTVVLAGLASSVLWRTMHGFS